MNIERMLFKGITVSPNPVEHLLAREHPAGRFEELHENLEFFWGQIDGMAVDQNFVTIEVHPNIPYVILMNGRPDAELSASKDRAHPRDQLPDTLAAHDQVYILIIF